MKNVNPTWPIEEHRHKYSNGMTHDLMFSSTWSHGLLPYFLGTSYIFLDLERISVDELISNHQLVLMK